ncbi:hypothetical protein Hanom_Chr05g00449711 [Helianthus anomalus]
MTLNIQKLESFFVSVRAISCLVVQSNSSESVMTLNKHTGAGIYLCFDACGFIQSNVFEFVMTLNIQKLESKLLLLKLIQEIEPLDVNVIQKDVPPTTVDAMKRTIS